MTTLPITDEQPKTETKKQPKKQEQAKSVLVETVAISLPETPNDPIESLASIDGIPLSIPFGHISKNCSIKGMTQEQKRTLSRMANGLQHVGAELKNGSKVKGTSGAVKWLLEQIAAE